MTESISRLITTLTAQRDIYIKLYGLSIQKRDAIEQQDLDKLNQIIKDEQPLLIQLQDSERERVKILSTFSLDIPADEITIQNIIDICPPTFITSLKRVHVELVNTLQMQVSINEINRKLINARLEYISFMMDSASTDINNAYNTSGSDARIKPLGPRMIDMEI